MEISRKSILTEDTMGLKALREKELALLPGQENRNGGHSKPTVNILLSLVFFFLMYSLACVYRIGILLLSHLLHNINITPFHNECF